MKIPVKSFDETATSLSKNPLGIIALFLVLVYGLASFVVSSEAKFTPAERIPLIYFLVFFPVLVLAVFSWLVIKHNAKLYGPGDYRYEENFVRLQMGIAVSLAAASVKGDNSRPETKLYHIVETARSADPSAIVSGKVKEHQILWVDDSPQNNVHERKAFEALGLRFTLVRSTDEALAILSRRKFAAIISDMSRTEGPREGYVLLDRLREKGDRTPLFFYTSYSDSEYEQETLRHGGQGSTDNPEELFTIVTKEIFQASGV
jgi:CheY-like chemotaxis protein